MALKALIFDVDGTLAETEEIHRKAFNRAFADAGLDWHWSRERYRELLSTSGGKERILRYIEEEHPEILEREDLKEWITGLHKSKTEHYKAMMAAGEVELRPGVERLIREAHEAGMRLAIATTTSPANITALFEATLGPGSLEWFEVIGDAEKAPVKKPDPSVYRYVLEELGLPPEECLAIEDTRNGVLAARAAGIPVLVTQSFYSEGEDFSGAIAVFGDLGEPHQPHQVFRTPGDSPGWVHLSQLEEWFAEGPPTAG